MSSDDYTLTVGLEVHVELKTRTKMFCGSKNDPDETRPNVNVCPICMGHPGTLPVINKEAVKHVLKVGLALGGQIAGFTEFDRKNYFYPDIPKGYQLSQYEFPLVVGGGLRGIAVTRVHLEEDTATSLHRDASDSPFVKGAPPSSAGRDFSKSSVTADGDTSFTKGGIKDGSGGFSLVDFNRAGVPLMELVTEPVIHSAKEAGDFARELQLLLRYLGVSDANMEKGEMRVEANISVSRQTDIADGRGLDADSRGRGQRESASGQHRSAVPLGTKVEVKNLNSFRALERAIVHEMGRQVDLLESGGRVAQETRGWDETAQRTFAQRRKEESHDYRYFPDPDLPKLSIRDISEFNPHHLRSEMPELPAARRSRFMALGIKKEDAATLVANRALGALFEEAVKQFSGAAECARAANYLTSDLLGLLKKTRSDANGVSVPFSAAAFVGLIRMTTERRLSSRGAKEVLTRMYEHGGNPEDIAAEQGLLQRSDAGELTAVVQGIIAANGKVVEDYKKGKMAALQFLVGLGMKATKGAANPEMLREIFTELLK